MKLYILHDPTQAEETVFEVWLGVARQLAIHPHGLAVKQNPEFPGLVFFCLEIQFPDLPNWPGFFTCYTCRGTFRYVEGHEEVALGEALEKYGADMFKEKLAIICEDCLPRTVAPEN